MGVTNEQYRTRFGMPGSFVKTRELVSHSKGIFWNTMLKFFFFLPQCILFTNIKLLDTAV